MKLNLKSLCTTVAELLLHDFDSNNMMYWKKISDTECPKSGISQFGAFTEAKDVGEFIFHELYDTIYDSNFTSNEISDKQLQNVIDKIGTVVKVSIKIYHSTYSYFFRSEYDYRPRPLHIVVDSDGMCNDYSHMCDKSIADTIPDLRPGIFDIFGDLPEACSTEEKKQKAVSFIESDAKQSNENVEKVNPCLRKYTKTKVIAPKKKCIPEDSDVSDSELDIDPPILKHTRSKVPAKKRKSFKDECDISDSEVNIDSPTLKRFKTKVAPPKRKNIVDKSDSELNIVPPNTKNKLVAQKKKFVLDDCEIFDSELDIALSPTLTSMKDRLENDIIVSKDLLKTKIDAGIKIANVTMQHQKALEKALKSTEKSVKSIMLVYETLQKSIIDNMKECTPCQKHCLERWRDSFTKSVNRKHKLGENPSNIKKKCKKDDDN